MSTVAVPRIPFYQMGFLDEPWLRAPRKAASVSAPRTPLYQLGFVGDGAKVLATAAPLAATAATTVASSIALISSAAGPIGAGIGILVGLIAGLWSAHEARAKGAKSENEAVNSALTAFDGSLKAIFAAANSSDPTQNISASQAAQQCASVLQTFWQMQAPYMSGPGRADTSSMGANCGTTSPTAPCAGELNGHKCDASCTASCCVGCQDLKPTIDQAIAVFQAGGGSVDVCAVAGSKYGASARGSYSLTYTPPAISGVSSLLSGGSSSLLPLLAIGGLAFFALS